ncbi:recombinase family protein [Streptomyces sp. SYSU K21746]
MKTTRTPRGLRARAVIYVRISQDRAGAHLGVDSQREDCEALAASRSWDVVETYVDNDLSAYSGKPRKGYRQMLADLEDGLATVVIVWHNDRLHRSPLELEGYIDLSQRRGIDTHTCVAGEIDLSTPGGRMNARMHGIIARHESEHKAERVARARQRNAKAGKWGGGIRPFGWGVPTGEMRKKIVKGTGEEIEVPVLDMNQLVTAEAEVLYSCAQLILSGGSIKAGVKLLSNKGFTTTRGNPISHVELRDMLLRERNAGIAIYQGEEIGKGAWEPIMSEAEFRAVAAILKDPSRRTSAGTTPRWFGSMIFNCGRGACTSKVVVTISGGRNHPSYRCRTSHGGGRRADILDQYIEDIIIERLSRPDAADLLLPGPSDVDVAALQLESEQIRRRMTDMAAMFGAGQMDMAQFTEGSDMARAQLEGVTQQLARAATRDPLVGLVGVPDVQKAWKGMELEQRRAVLRALLTVTLRPARPGRMPDGGYFDYDAIEYKWKRGGH